MALRLSLALALLALMAAHAAADCGAGCELFKRDWSLVRHQTTDGTKGFANQDAFPYHAGFFLDARDTDSSFFDGYASGAFWGSANWTGTQLNCVRNKPENVYLVKTQKRLQDGVALYVTFVDAQFTPTLDAWTQWCTRLFSPDSADSAYFVELDGKQKYTRKHYGSFNYNYDVGYYTAADGTCDPVLQQTVQTASSCLYEIARDEYNRPDVLPSQRFCGVSNEFAQVTVAFDCSADEKYCDSHSVTDVIAGQLNVDPYFRSLAAAPLEDMRRMQRSAMLRDSRGARSFSPENDPDLSCWLEDKWTFAPQNPSPAALLASGLLAVAVAVAAALHL